MNQVIDDNAAEYRWKHLYKVGGGAAIVVVLVALLEIIITFLPGGGIIGPTIETVSDWFDMLQDNRFLGLRNLGLLNIFITALGVPVFLALFGVHRRVNVPYAALAMIISFIGAAVFLATNKAFPMLDLSNQYSIATSDTQRAVLEAAGQAMLSIGQSHTPGTFLGFFLSEVAGLIISIVMLRGKIFSKATAYVGIVAFSSFLIFEISSSFVPVLSRVTMIFAMIGGILSMVWYILTARVLFQLGRLQ